MESTSTASYKTSIIVPQPSQNVLLSLLNAETAARIYPHLLLVPMELGHVLYEPGDTMKNVYFPIDCIVSLLYVMESGASAEISVVGKEGMVGVSLFMGGASTPSRAVVQSAGQAYLLNSKRLIAEFNRHGDMLMLLLRYTQALITHRQWMLCVKRRGGHHRGRNWLPRCVNTLIYTFRMP
jgi:hypothetical protein